MSKIVNFKKNILALAIATCALASISESVFAQSTDDLTTNSAEGNYGSMQRSMITKRDAVGVIEVISSESPGEISDSNLTEALQRISGVAVYREDGEASRIIVRGIDQDLNLVTVNDRKMPTVRNDGPYADATREFDFRNLTGNGVEGIHIYKTGRADRSVGGLGATINVKTLRPFDIDGSRSTVNVKAATDTSVGKGDGDQYTPEASALFSWANEQETLGATFAGSYNQRDFTVAQGKSIEPVYFPLKGTAAQPGTSRIRENAQGTFQYRPIHSLTATLDYLYSKNRIEQLLEEQSQDGIDYRVIEISELNASSEINSVGFNLEYVFNPEMTVAIDYHDSTALGRDDQSAAWAHDPINTLLITQSLSADSSSALQEVDIKQLRVNGSYHLDTLGVFTNTTLNLGLETRTDISKNRIDDIPSFYLDGSTLQESLRAVQNSEKFKWNDFAIEESVGGGFIQVATATNVGSKLAHFLAGVHVEKTDVASNSFNRHPSMIVRNSDSYFDVIYADEDANYGQRTSYTNTLPNFDLDLAITNTVKTRLSLSKTFGRASYEHLRPDVSIHPYQKTATAWGNPALKPLESKNIDVSVEWYYETSSFASLGYFRKDLSNLIGEGIESKEFYGLRDMTLATNYAERVAQSMMTGIRITSQPTDPIAHFSTSLPVNNREMTIDGLEFTLQHIFDTSGFGVQTNYTKVNSKNASNDTVGEYEFALLGVSDSANLVAYYEKNAWRARAAYNWRDKYLDAYYFGAEYVADFTEFDCSLDYKVNKNLTVTMEAFNITGEDPRQFNSSNTSMEKLSDFGARYKIGARYLF